MSADEQSILPPLLGDGKGRYKVKIVGNSGSGKTTLGAELAKILGVPFIPLDTLFWTPGWGSTARDEFRSKVQDALAQSDKGWVVDGNYTKKIGTLVEDSATDVIWLDPPLVLYFPRLCYRTLLRLLSLAPPCSPGCPESFREVFFSSDSIVWWCLSNHWSVRKRETEAFTVNGIHVGGRHRRIGGWGRELAAWKQSVKGMIRVDGDDD